MDLTLSKAAAQIGEGRKGELEIKAFFDPVTSTVSYIVHDAETRHGAIIDSVLDYDPASGRTSCSSAQAIIDYVEDQELTIDWLLETHVHADHLSAAPYLQQRLGGQIAIGEHVRTVQATFGKLFNAEAGFKHDVSVVRTFGSTRGLGRVDKRDSQPGIFLIQGFSLGSSHGSWGFVGCGMGADRAAAAV